MPKIIFVEPPLALEEIYMGLAETASISPPLNLLLLASITRKHGMETAVMDCPALSLGYDAAAKNIAGLGPDYVGLTAMTPTVLNAGKLAEKIKKINPSIVTILGGVHMTVAPVETMNRLPNVDIGVIGEAELTILPLMNALGSKKDLDTIPGIAYRAGGQVRVTPAGGICRNLDTLPYYAWDLLEGFPERYRPPLFSYNRIPATPVITSRGCPGNCVFCYSGNHKSTCRTYSSEYMFGMIKHLLSSYGIREIMIYDDNFVMYRKNLAELCTKLIEAKLDITWNCNARIDMVDEEILSLMKRSGCWQVSYGIESGSQRIIDLLGKKTTIDKIRNAVRITKKTGIRTVGYFMIGSFGETAATMDETVKFAMDSGLDDFRMSFFTPLPGTKALDIAGKYGTMDTSDWGSMNLFQPAFVPAGMTKNDLTMHQKKAIRKFFFRIQIIISYIRMVKKPLVILKGAVALAKYIFGRNYEYKRAS